MKKILIVIMTVLLSINLSAQVYSDDVVYESSDARTVTVRATAAADKKKDAEVLAVKSAFNTLFLNGIEGLKNGMPMMVGNPAMQKKQNAYIYRFFSEDRYLSYISGEVEKLESEKFGGKQRVTSRVTVNYKPLIADMQRNKITINPAWAEKDALGPNGGTKALNPTIVVVPEITSADGSGFAAMRSKLEKEPELRNAISEVNKAFAKNDFKTRDFITQLQNMNTDRVLRTGTQTDEATMIAQQLPGDIVVYTSCVFTSTGNQHSCNVSVRAIEKQTAGNLGEATYNSGMYPSNKVTKGELASYATAKISKEFMSQIQSSFENMIAVGREVIVNISLSESVTDWDLDQDTPVGNAHFGDSLEEWLRTVSFQDTYKNDVYTSKYTTFSVNIPLWNNEKNRSYTLSNFGSDLRKFFKAQFGDTYKMSISYLGQKITVTIE